jgi:hypothetical protein
MNLNKFSPIKHLYILCLIVVISMASTINLMSQSAAVKQIRLTEFQLQSSSLILASGEELSVADYKSNVYWFPVKVPSTVLSGLVANKIYPDPYSGLNNMLIPDASDEFNKKYNLEQYSYRRIQLVGGAWVPDFMLNCDSTRYDYEMHLCRNANINLARIPEGWPGAWPDNLPAGVLGNTQPFIQLSG